MHIMKIYEQPEMQVETFEIEDIITSSSNETPFAPVGGNN